jgi:acetylornithine/succinyldiaminopimelate/putrescine aminotransferase
MIWTKYNLFGRTGKLAGFQNYDVIPDVVVMEGMGSGMPVGAFTASEKNDGFIKS